MRLFVLAWAAVIASFPLNDNSFFTHLATGRIILDDRSVPSSDPYTFTAAGEDWTVQSWLASVAYAGAERVGGEVGLRLLVLAVFVVAALLLWRLSAAAESLFPRLVIVFGALFVFTGLWSERPMMVGVIGLGIVWLALHGGVPPLLLVPLLWIWANSHGSFPLAFVLIGAVVIGEVLDSRKAHSGESERGDRRRSGAELTVLKFTALGTLLAAVGPLGLDVLLFPLKTFSRSDLLSEVVEWQPPAYRSLAERAFLVLVLLTFAAVARHGSWRVALPALVFIGAALYAQRNIVMATIILVPVLAACAPRLGTLTARTRPGIGVALTAVCAVAAVLAGVLTVTGPTFSLSRYPVAPLAWLDSTEVLDDGETRLATQDRVGNLIEMLDGRDGSVFFDDRADMFPADVFADYLVLLRGEPEWAAVLDQHRIDAVLWERSRPLPSLLSVDRRWQTVFSDGTWTVSCRRGQPICDDLAA